MSIFFWFGILKRIFHVSTKLPKIEHVLIFKGTSLIQSKVEMKESHRLFLLLSVQ